MILSERIVKPAPFAISRNVATSLTSQVEGGLRQAIASGYYRDGDFIPGYIELARGLNVSTAVVRRAVARLVADGFCQPRRGVGLRICAAGEATRGNVLVVIGGDAAAYRYYMANLVEHLRRRLAASHLALSRAIVPRVGGKEVVSELSSALNQHVSLAVLLDHTRETERMIAAAGVPYVLMAPAPQTKHPAGYLEGCGRETAEAIAAHCVACGARRVLLADLPAQRGFHIDGGELREALNGHSIQTQQIEIGKKSADLRTEEILQDTVAYFTQATAGGALDVQGFHPDMVVFLDDYVAQGALLTIAAAGIRVPEDLQVVSMANKGLGPVWLKPLTRFEVDASKEADAFAELAVACLRDRTRRHVRKSSVAFIEGATTRRA